MLFELLQTALHQRTANPALFENCSEKEWEACRKLAVLHGVMALAWDGVLTLPNTLMPPKNIKILWGIAVEKYEKRYRYYCEAAQSLSDLFASHGIATLILKGVGLSACYPIPSHREGGDIDIYTYSADTSRMSHEEANALANQLIRDQGIEVNYENKKHSKFYYRNIPIENHSTFLEVGLFQLAEKMEPILHRQMKVSTVQLLDGQYTLQVPSPEFNLIFVAFHALQHCANELSLHHLCDWACLIDQHGLDSLLTVGQPDFIESVKALTGCTNQLLGTKVDIPVNTLTDTLLYEIFRSEFHDVNFPTGKFNILWYKTRKLVHFMHLKKQVLHEPYIRTLSESFANHLLHPKIFFEK